MELNRETIPQYLHERQIDIGFFDLDAELISEEIGDGNLNFVYRVYDAARPTRSVVLKQAPPYIKILGPDYPLPSDRLTYESRSLEIYNQFASQAVPTQYYFDGESAVIVMEDLRNYSLLRDDLIAGHVNQTIPELIGKFMGSVHSQTYSNNLDNVAVDKYKEDFANTVMQSITADYVFTFPFTDHETNFFTDGLEAAVNQLKTDHHFLQEVDALRRIFLTVQRGLTHGDLHTGSVMVSGKAGKVIDSEFAFYGPVGFDVGLFWANYLLSYYSHIDNSKVQSELITAIIRTWETYIEQFMMEQTLKIRTLQCIFHEAVGFTGLEMLRRIVGAAHVKDIEQIEDVKQKLRVETAILEFGRTIVKERHNITTVHEMVEFL
ncbi:MAG: S-methyl-5-thioribose kinase [Candidatus Poribacteria bacterium]|nr:S-methyl-5-thioribose kinase [Candidatus Poribacteria bacterium]